MTKEETYKHKFKSKSSEELSGIRNTLMNCHTVKDKQEKYRWLTEMIERRRRVVSGLEEVPEVVTQENVVDCVYDFDEHLCRSYLAKKTNSKSRNIEMDLSLSEYRKLLKRKKCAYTGVVLLDAVEYTHPQKRTVDRVDNTKGYTKDNCVAVSYKANQLKNILFEDPHSQFRLTVGEFKMFCKNVT